MDEYHQYAAVAKTIGVKVNFLTPDQVKEIWPYVIQGFNRSYSTS